MSRIRELVRIRELARSGVAREIRTRAGLSLAEVATELGVDPGAVAKWETGKSAPRAEVALRYARLLRELEEVGA
jgi:transcriptional regulator with XRE-family HTH domain